MGSFDLRYKRAVTQSPSVGFFGCRHAKSVALEFLRRFRRILLWALAGGLNRHRPSHFGAGRLSDFHLPATNDIGDSSVST
ncbi:hypothetical protein M569_09847 [Genlisea aurea]|uniref:Uncharacterized protein n=1 Tax=Genlisea aurea TaxID=192259 RepID=S8DYB1_9LAMI|nr:hypothetical protein M569_09847 [Genlisea aurea]